MKKAAPIIKFVLLIVFITAGVFSSINLYKMNKAQSLIENVTNKDVSYFTDEFFVFSKYYKFKDADSKEYWIRKSNDKFAYFYSAVESEEMQDIDEAINSAYSQASKWDKSFFASDTFCQIADESQYTFYIHQLDEAGYKTGKYIVVKAPNGYISSIYMHTSKNKSNPDLGSSIGEDKAINMSFNKTTETDHPLQRDSDHLISAEFYRENDKWIWDIKIWNITQEDISSKSTPINQNEYFSCILNASTGKVISFEWISEK
ncbi:MAG: hypothetical protein AB1Z23_09975 [Eubacteriales bacterium]